MRLSRMKKCRVKTESIGLQRFQAFRAVMDEEILDAGGEERRGEEWSGFPGLSLVSYRGDGIIAIDSALSGQQGAISDDAVKVYRERWLEVVEAVATFGHGVNTCGEGVVQGEVVEQVVGQPEVAAWLG